MEQRTIEWFDARVGKITASEMHKIMSTGKSKPLTDTAETYLMGKVAEQLVGYSDSLVTPAMSWGIEYEALAKYQFTKRTGIEVTECGFIQHPICQFKNFYGGSPDGLTSDGGIIEIKCPFNTSKHLEYCMIKEVKDIPKDYFWQMVCNMRVTNTEHCYFVSFDPRIDHDCGLFIYKFEMNHNTHIHSMINQIDLSVQFMENVKNNLNI